MLRLIGMGAQKAGRTWLHRLLARHSAVEFPAGKEVYFWDRHFPERGEEAHRALFSTDPDRCECEISPACAFRRTGTAFHMAARPELASRLSQSAGCQPGRSWGTHNPCPAFCGCGDRCMRPLGRLAGQLISPRLP